MTEEILEASWLEEEEKISFIVFTAAGVHFALQSSHVRMIRPFVQCTYVPGCPDHILGVIHNRGEIHSVSDLRLLLSLPAEAPDQSSRIIITKLERLETGLLADSVDDIIEIPISRISEPIPTLPEHIRSLVSGDLIHKDMHISVLSTKLLEDRLTGGAHG